MSCGAECMSLGPPPDSILYMPPPPLPAFLANAANLTPPCRASKCPTQNNEENSLFPGVEYHELPRHVAGVAEPGGGDETWLLVVITCCVAVLCVAALLALFLFRCRESRSGCKSSSGKAGGSNVLYGGAALDSRVLWAALTPRGTRHFVADTYPHDETEDHHYECVEPPLYKLGPPEDLAITRHFNVEYEDPAPLIENYADRTEEYFRNGMETLRRGRPLVSSPTRIERPNLPPLNLQPRTLRRAPHSRRVSDANNPEKAAI